MDIIQEKRGRNVVYYIGQRDFELPELKLLVDAVQASRFITKKKSQILIKKLESLSSDYEAEELQRQVYVTDGIKADNEKYYMLGYDDEIGEIRHYRVDKIIKLKILKEA